MASSDNFVLEFEGTINNKIPVKKYKSKATDIKIVFIDIIGPLVNGYFCLSTEASSDDGLPHTLEHVIFLGSERYPYKGVLDKVATISLSEGTNAWTDKDHTCYTITTAGSEGFLQLVPIYLDHILYPVLSESAYLTEVHHITEEGKDAGVVYSEMQADENTGSNKVFLEMLRNIYPKDSGYRFETGGILKNLRESTNNKKVKEFHKQFYIPKNLCLIVTGTIDHQQFFNVLSGFEKIILSKGEQHPNFKRPWTKEIEPLSAPVPTRTVEFPSDDSDEGLVTVAWRGPKITNQMHLMALTVLLEFFTESPIALLNQTFVEIPEPCCGEVTYTIVENSEVVFCLEFEGVMPESLTQIQLKLLQLLNDLSDGKLKFNMERMKIVVNNKLVEMINQLEDDPHETTAVLMIGDFLYGTGITDSNEKMRQVEIVRSLLEHPESFWLEFIKSYMIRGHNVTVIGKPSPEEVKKCDKEEEDRISERKASIGHKGLEERKKMLLDAISENNKPFPEDFLANFTIPTTKNLQYHPIKSYHNCQQFGKIKADYSLTDLANMPCCFQLDDVKNEFISINVCIDMQKLPAKLVPYLPTYIEVLFELPMTRDGVQITYESVINKLHEDTVEYSSSLGILGSRFNPGEFSSSLIINVKVEMAKLEAGVKWCGELLANMNFTPDRISAVAKKLMSDIKQKRREADVVVDSLSVINIFDKNSVPYSSSLLVQQSFLGTLSSLPSATNSIPKFKEIQKYLMSLDRIYIHMTTDLEKLNKQLNGMMLSDVWKRSFFKIFEGVSTVNKELSWSLKGDVAAIIDPSKIDPSIVGLGSTDSGYLVQAAECFVGFSHSDVPALLVFCHFVSFLEGPMWKLIRGKGLAYSFSLAPDFGEGLLYFRIEQSPNIYEAYSQALGFLENVIKDNMSITGLELDCAKCQCIYELIQSVQTPSMTSKQAFSCFMRNIPLDYYMTLIDQIEKVTIDQLKKIAKDYISKLVTVEASTIFIACNLKELPKVVDKFQTLCQCKFVVSKTVNAIALKK